MESYNIAQALDEMAAGAPFRPAIIFPAGRDAQGRARFTQLSFQQLREACDSYAHGFAAYGIRRGDRTLLLVRPGLDLIAATFALLKIGAVPVLIDPGLGRKAFLQCVADAEPTALIGIPLAHVIRLGFPKAFRTVQCVITAGKRWFWGGATLAELCAPRREPFPVAPTMLEDEAAIAFTSGGTGLPKGVIYQQGVFRAQIKLMREEMHVAEGEVHLAAMYIFALFNPALGVTTVIPDMEPRKTAKLNPAFLVEAIQTHGVTMSLGSPLIWKILGDYCLEHEIRLPSLKHLFMFGDAASPQVVARFAAVMAGGKVYTPYGATEALPLTLIDEQTILAETARLTAQGAGVCVGKPLGGVEIRVIPLSDEPIPLWQDSLALPPGEIGEIIVKGAVVTQQYLNRPEQTALAKIAGADGARWHRMGDVGYLDAAGRVWVCGRKAHRVVTANGLLLPIPCETIFNAHPAVARTALVGVGEYGQQTPVLVVEPKCGKMPGSATAVKTLIAELLAQGAQFEHTRPIRTILFHPSLPVDVRHNTKIQRQELAVWAAQQLKRKKSCPYPSPGPSPKSGEG